MSRGSALSSNKSKAKVIADWDYYSNLYFSFDVVRGGSISFYKEDKSGANSLYYSKNNSESEVFFSSTFFNDICSVILVVIRI